MRAEIGDIWQYSYPEWGTAHLLVLDYFWDEDYYLCLNLEKNEVGDWIIDLINEREASKWKFIS